MTPRRRVVIGIDTHLDTIHLAAITDTGQLLGDAEFATSPAGYWAAICWARSFGEVLSVGVEGTGSYGAGITQALQANDIHVAEVNLSLARVMGPPDCQGDGTTVARY